MKDRQLQMEDIEALRSKIYNVIGEEIEPVISSVRNLMNVDFPGYETPVGQPTRKEVRFFVGCQGSLFFSDFGVNVDHFEETGEWLLDVGRLRAEIRGRLDSPLWLQSVNIYGSDYVLRAADLWLPDVVSPERSDLWVPDGSVVPVWASESPSVLMLAAQLLAKGRALQELHWRKLELLIGEMLEKEGWSVEVMRGSKDGGVDVIAGILHPVVGPIKTLWQAKKYSASRRVKVHEVRELSAIRSEMKASKALIVTTSRLTKDAIEWVKRDSFQLGYMEGSDIEAWIRRLVDKKK